MALKKKDVQKVGPLTKGKKNIIEALMEEYDIENTDAIQAALRDILGGHDQIHDVSRDDRSPLV